MLQIYINTSEKFWNSMKVGKINIYHNKIFCSAQILQLPSSDTIQDETLFYKYDTKRVEYWDVTIRN